METPSRRRKPERTSKALSQGSDPEGTSVAAAQRPCHANQEIWRWKGLPFSHLPVGVPCQPPQGVLHSPRPSSTPCQLLAEALTSQQQLPRPCFLQLLTAQSLSWAPRLPSPQPPLALPLGSVPAPTVLNGRVKGMPVSGRAKVEPLRCLRGPWEWHRTQNSPNKHCKLTPKRL